MNLKFICHEGFEIANEVCDRIQGYLPNLVHDVGVIRTEAFNGVFSTWEILPKIERVAKPDWEHDIVLVVIQGSVYFTDIELYDEVASTLDYLIQRGDRIEPFSERPKIGGQYLPGNMSKELKGAVEYWAKLGVEEILHYFGIPEQHDENCFFHPKEYGKATVEDGKKDYCPKCRKFMLHLESPRNFDDLSAQARETYEFNPKPTRRGERIFERLLRQRSGKDSR